MAMWWAGECFVHNSGLVAASPHLARRYEIACEFSPQPASVSRRDGLNRRAEG